MAEEFLQSNIVIATKFTRPETSELKTIHGALLSIENRLKRLTEPAKPWTIKLFIDDSELQKYSFKLQQVSSGKATGPAPTPGATPAATAPPPQAPPRPFAPLGDNVTGRRTTQAFKEIKGETVQTSNELLLKQQTIEKGILKTATEIADTKKKTTKYTVDELNLLKQAQTAEEKRAVMQGIKARVQQQQERLAEQGRELGGRVRGDVKAGRFPETMEYKAGEETITFQRIAASERAAIETRKINQKARDEEIAAAQAHEKIVAADHVKSEAAKRKQDIDLAQQTDEVIATNHHKTHLKSLDQEADSRKRAENREAKAHAKAGISQAESERRIQSVRGGVSGLQAEGFVAGPSTRKYDTLTNSMKELHNLTRVTGDAFRGYTVEVAKADEATGKIIVSTLTGSAAMKALGDSVLRSIVKVGMWTVATTAIFGTIAAITAATTAVVDLEEQMAFLARVAGGFAGGNASFQERYEATRKLTNEILNLTEAYGGMASEALEAAAVFARAGKTEKEVLEGVRASLIAARIAELELVDAAKLLSSAMVQFNLATSQLLPTLDSLNTLSNNYQVTTNDLLQAISRTGSVFAEHNGRLTELAAITAVVAKRTSRSGSEIGNAIKTIVSNLDRLDVQKSVMEKLGVSTITLEGKSKSLSQILLEVRGSMDGLSTAQQKQLLIQIAGVRQANILVAAIHEIDEAVVAENKALTESGSSIEEAKDRAFTLTATLQRLSATLVKLSRDASGPLLILARSVLNITQAVLQMLDAFNGWPATLSAAAGILYALTRALQVCSIQLKVLAVETVEWLVYTRLMTAATAQTVVANRLAAVSLGLLSGAMRIAGATAALFGNAMKAILSPTGLFAIAMIGITVLLGSAAQAQNTYEQSLKDSQDVLKGQIAAEEQRRQAVENSVLAISHLIKRQEDLTAAGKEAEAEKAGEAIEKISGSISGGGLGLSRTSTVEEAVAAGQREKFISLEVEKKRREALIEARQTEVHEAQDKLRAAQRFIGRTANKEYVAQVQAGANVLGTAFRQGISIPAAQEKVQLQYIEAENKARRELAKLMEEQEKDAKAIADAQVKMAKLAQDEEKIVAGLAKLQRSRLGMAEFERDVADQRYRISLQEGDAFDDQVTLYHTITQEAQRQLEELNSILDTTENITEAEAGFAEECDRVVKLLQEQYKLKEQIDALIVKSSKESFGTALEDRNRLYGGVAEITRQKERGLSDTASKYGEGISKIEVERQQQIERIRANEEAAEAIRGSNLTGPQKKGALDATKLDTQEALNELRKLEVDQALALLEAEKDITVERKKSADEAARALGVLSSEDKLRARAQAAYFAANPNKRLTFEEQMNMTAEDLRITQQFFGGRVESFSESKGALAEQFRAGGLGETEDIVKGQKEIDAARRGRTDQEIIGEALKKGGKFEDQRRGLMGEAGGGLNMEGFGAGPLGPGGGRGVDMQGRAKNELEIGLREGTFDFSPLIESFQSTVEESLQVAIDQMAEGMNDLRKQIMALQTRRVPGTAVAPAP